MIFPRQLAELLTHCQNSLPTSASAAKGPHNPPPCFACPWPLAVAGACGAWAVDTSGPLACRIRSRISDAASLSCGSCSMGGVSAARATAPARSMLFPSPLGTGGCSMLLISYSIPDPRFPKSYPVGSRYGSAFGARSSGECGCSAWTVFIGSNWDMLERGVSVPGRFAGGSGAGRAGAIGSET